MMKLLPLIVFLALAGFLYFGLQRDPSLIQTPLLNKPAPEFVLPVLASEDSLDSSSLAGRVWVLNVFASWCAACVQEHPLLVDLAAQRDITLVGLNYKDQPDDAVAWLDRFGDPFEFVADDRAGDVGIDWGVYGVPETFVIDAQGKVRYKHIGPLTDEAIETTLLPLLDSLLESQTVSLR